MNLGILTWYQAINHGAILQAYAMSQYLTQQGYNTELLDYKWEVYVEKSMVLKMKYYIHRVIGLCKEHNLFNVSWYKKRKKFNVEKREVFNRFLCEELQVGPNYKEGKKYDAVLIGSDMVFDVGEGYNPYMYGQGVNSSYIFSYAASFGYTTKKLLDKSGKIDEIRYNINQMKALGVRDENTRILLEFLKVTPNIKTTIDPVLLYGFQDEFEAWDTKKWSNIKYLLLYSYENHMNTEKEISIIRSIANRYGLQVVSAGYYHYWCDENVNASPKEFLELVKYATYIITDTFHGAIFSLIAHKQFVAMISGNGFKVKDLLVKFALENRIADSIESISDLINVRVDYNEFEAILEEERKSSGDFIKDNLAVVSSVN